MTASHHHVAARITVDEARLIPLRGHLAKQFKDDSVKAALKELEGALAGCDFTAAAIEAAIHATTEKLGMGQGKLNQPLRAAVTGVGVGAGIYETLELLGKDLSMKRLDAFFKR